MTPAVVVGLVAATATAAFILGRWVERHRQERALDAAIQIIDQFATDNLARAARQDATDRPWRGQWVATPSAWATYTEGPEKAGEN